MIISCGNSKGKKPSPGSDVSDQIRVNQLGYYPSLSKRFTVAGGLADSFMLVNEKGVTLFKGALTDHGLWEPSGEILKSGDFSEFKKEGTYFIHIPGTGNSYPFQISDSIIRMQPWMPWRHTSL